MKFTCRRLAKNYLGNLKKETYGLLKDVSYFANMEEITLLDQHVKPFLHEEAVQAQVTD